MGERLIDGKISAACRERLRTIQGRMLATITETAEERYAALLRSDPNILQHAPLKYIATYLGITDTSLSRIRAGMLKK